MCKINGKKLAEIRKENGMTQKQFAEALGVSKSAIQNYEREGKFTYAMGELIYNLTDEVVENADAEAEDILNTIMNDFKVRESDGFETE